SPCSLASPMPFSLSLHDALPICVPLDGDERTFAVAVTEAGRALREKALDVPPAVIDRLGLPLERLVALRDELSTVIAAVDRGARSEEHTSELQSRFDRVCRLLLE